jgi:hypothetical protein
MTPEEPLFARLQRLRREGAEERAGRVPAAPVSLRAALPDWLRVRLGQGSGGAPAACDHAPALAAPERLCEEHGPRGACTARHERFDARSTHGTEPLERCLELSPAAFTLFGRAQSLAHVDLARAVFLDIETTGLAGGAGTYSFLVALGSFTPAGFEVWQGFLRGPEEEAALLAVAAERIAASACIVSFFGKSFDRHRLEDKMRLHGIRAPFTERPHLDLYYPCARLYKGALPDGRLATLERDLCGVLRAGDLPGSLAPAAWFDYLARRPHRLEQVFAHNLKDVLSLVALTTHLGRAAAGGLEAELLPGPAAERALGLSRLAEERGQYALALEWIELSLARGVRAERAARARRAKLLVRLKRRDEARAEYERLAAEGADDVRVAAHCALAGESLRAGRLADAARTCESAEVLLEECLCGAAYARWRRELARLCERLEKRRARPRASPK